MDILKELEHEIKQQEESCSDDVLSHNKISTLKSILKIKKDNDKGVACKKLLYLLLVKICVVLIDLQHEDIVKLDMSDLNMIADKLGDPESTVDDLQELVGFLLEERYGAYYSILKLRDELIGIIYERMILEKKRS